MFRQRVKSVVLEENNRIFELATLRKSGAANILSVSYKIFGFLLPGYYKLTAF
jgi:hypothetical protein